MLCCVCVCVFCVYAIHCVCLYNSIQFVYNLCLCLFYAFACLRLRARHFQINFNSIQFRSMRLLSISASFFVSFPCHNHIYTNIYMINHSQCHNGVCKSQFDRISRIFDYFFIMIIVIINLILFVFIIIFQFNAIIIFIS
jgi:hypothetical protein